MRSFGEFEEGVEIGEIRNRHKEALKEAERGYAGDLSGRAAAWAGTGVGLVRTEQSAKEIVEEVRSGIVAALDAARARL